MTSHCERLLEVRSCVMHIVTVRIVWCFFVCNAAGQLRAGVVATAQLSAGARPAAAHHQARPVRRSVLEHAALRAALDRRRRLARGLGWTTVAQRDRGRYQDIGERRCSRIHETASAAPHRYWTTTSSSCSCCCCSSCCSISSGVESLLVLLDGLS